MGRYKLPEYDFDPEDMDKTLMPGDVLRVRGNRVSHGSGRVLVLVKKIYEADMTISYLFKSTGDKRNVRIKESTFMRPGGGGYSRIYKTPRKIVSTEKTYTGHFFGKQEAA